MLWQRFSSLVFWAFLVSSSIALFPFAVLVWAATVLFDRRLVLLHRFTCFWASLYTWVNPQWPMTIEGARRSATTPTYVMVANHLSLLDILVLFRIFKHFKWVSKIENFRVPCVGWNMTLNRYVKLRRGDRESVKQMMAACEQTLRSGSSIMMFPEGTRSKTGVLQPFKTGAFELALRTRMPLLRSCCRHQRHPAQARLRVARSPPDFDHRPRPDPSRTLPRPRRQSPHRTNPPDLRPAPGGERGRSSEWTGCGLEGHTWASRRRIGGNSVPRGVRSVPRVHS